MVFLWSCTPCLSPSTGSGGTPRSGRSGRPRTCASGSCTLGSCGPRLRCCGARARRRQSSAARIGGGLRRWCLRRAARALFLLVQAVLHRGSAIHLCHRGRRMSRLRGNTTCHPEDAEPNQQQRGQWKRPWGRERGQVLRNDLGRRITFAVLWRLPVTSSCLDKTLILLPGVHLYTATVEKLKVAAEQSSMGTVLSQA